MVTNVWEQSREGALVLTASQPPRNTQSAAVQWLAANFDSRWFGTPSLFRPPAIDNTDFRFFDVSGHTQNELIRSLNAVVTAVHGRRFGLAGGEMELSVAADLHPRGRACSHRY